MLIEKETLYRFIDGDKSAYEKIYKLYFPKVIKFIVGFVKDIDTSKDIAQAVFIILLKKYSLFKDVSDFDSYLFKIVKNEVIKYMKSAVACTSIDESPVEVGNKYASNTPYEDLVAQDIKLIIDLLVDEMPKQRQQVFKMSRHDGYDNGTIALKLNITKKTVENHLNLALNSIRVGLSYYNILIFLLIFILGVNE